MTEQKEISHSWWFSQDRLNVRNQSPWLSSTLSELEEKTKQMLKLIEGDSDSFAQRAEMYYTKRPQLVGMIKEFYRAHRSLAEQYDQLKYGRGAHLSMPSSPSKSVTNCSWSISNTETDETPKCSSELFCSKESEANDPQQEQFGAETRLTEVPEKKTDSNIEKLKHELQILKEENAALESEIANRGEEKMEVVRHLPFQDVVTQANDSPREHIKDLEKKERFFRFKKLKKVVFFGGWSKSHTNKSESEDPQQQQFGANIKLLEVPDGKTNSGIANSQCELHSLKEENAAIKTKLARKEDKKIEIIRPGTTFEDFVMDKNVSIWHNIKEDSRKKSGSFGFKKLKKHLFFWKLFGGQSKSQSNESEFQNNLRDQANWNAS